MAEEEGEASSALPPQGVDPPDNSSPSNVSESPIKRRPVTKPGSWRAQFKKLRQSAGQASPQGESVRDWDRHVNTIIRNGYYTVTWRFQRLRDARAEIAFFRAIDPTIPLPDTDGTSSVPVTHNRQPPLRQVNNKAGPPW